MNLIGLLYPITDENGNIAATRTITHMLAFENIAGIAIKLNTDSNDCMFLNYSDACRLIDPEIQEELKQYPSLDTI